jgi:hemerythrin-like domain-containing protein
MARRHESLIPLSRQHHDALALALVIRRRDGIEQGERAWVDARAAEVTRIYSAELDGHFAVEEAVLFPAMERNLGRLPLLAELRAEHERLRELVVRLETSPSVPLLDDFSRLLEGHVRKEERRLFVEFERRMPSEAALKLGREIETRLSKVCQRL